MATTRDRGVSWSRCVVANVGLLSSQLGNSVGLSVGNTSYALFVDNAPDVVLNPGRIHFSAFDAPP